MGKKKKKKNKKKNKKTNKTKKNNSGKTTHYLSGRPWALAAT